MIVELTQAKVSGEKKTDRQQREADSKLVLLADGWDEWVAGGTFPDFVK
jgi:hypothetical protein